MEPIGYLLLAGIAFIALKAFGGTSSTALKPVFTGKTDPNTGAKLIDSTAKFVGPVQPIPANIPATDLGNGQMWCPYPLTLYKDAGTGKYFCVNETVQPTSTIEAPGAIAYDSVAVAADVIAQQTSSYSAPTILQAPSDFVQTAPASEAAAATPDIVFVQGGTSG